jgi:tetratricopeptide (TPR) repeat protein
MVSIALALILSAASAERPTLAILPPVPIEDESSWLGLAVADNLATDLLRYSPKDKKTGQRQYPFNVFSWRETTSAARSEGLDVKKPLSPESVARLARQLGARYVFTGSYKVKAGKMQQVLMKWRLVDTESDKPAKEMRVITNMATLSTRSGALTIAVLKLLGEKAPKPVSSPRYSTKALKAYASGLEILARQSLEPHAPVMVPPLETKKARVLFESATEEAPEFLRGWIGQGLASAMLGEMDRAEKDVLHALAHAEHFEPLNALGLYYFQVRQAKSAEAIKTLEEATAKHPGFLGALGYLGSAYLRSGQPKKAEEVFARYKERVPKSPWARLMHSRAVAYGGDPAAALMEMRSVQKDFPDSLVVSATLAVRLSEAKLHDEAITTLDRAIGLHGEHPILLTRLSYVHLQKGAAEQALAIARRAVASLGATRGETMAGYAHVNLGHALALLGKKDEALAAFKTAVQLGVGVEERLLVLADERTKPLMQDPANPLVKDAPPPPPPLPPPPPEPEVAPEEAAPAEAAAQPPSAAETAAQPPSAAETETWVEGKSWSENDDWSEETFDDEPNPAPAPGAAEPPAEPVGASATP